MHDLAAISCLEYIINLYVININNLLVMFRLVNAKNRHCCIKIKILQENERDKRHKNH